MNDDLISRQAAIDALLHNQEVYANHFGNDPIDKYTIALIDNDAQTIAQLPSVQSERKEGNWRLNKEGNWACPFCEFDPYHDEMNGMNYCPNCGERLKMPLADCGRRREDDETV